MPDRKSFYKQVSEDVEQLSTGAKGGLLGFILALLLLIFGFWKTLFVLLMTAVGYVLGVRLIYQYGGLRQLLNKVFPPGFFR